MNLQRTSLTTQEIAFIVMSEINDDLLERKQYAKETIAHLSNLYFFTVISVLHY